MKKLTVVSVVGLVAGAVLGALTGSGTPGWLGTGLDWFVRAWTGAFSVIVLPLVVGLLFAAIADASVTTASRKLGLSVPTVFAGLLVFVALATTVISQVALTMPGLQSLSLPVLSKAPPAVEAVPDGSGWLAMSPQRLLAAAAGGDVLALMSLTFVAALLARRIPAESRGPLVALSRSIAELMMVGARGLLAVAPLIMFAVAFLATRSSGSNVGAVMLAFVTLKSVVCFVVVLSLYPVTAMLGGVSITRLAQALLPAQMVALTSRSSLATLPALLDGARNKLTLAPGVPDVVLPVAGATLKLSRAFSSPIKLLFLAHVLGLSLTPSQIVIFTATILLLSPATVGMPQMVSSAKSLPAFVAAGVPAEYAVLLGLTTGLTDAFVTVLNSTGYMGASVIVNRLVGRREAVVDAPQGVPVGSADARSAIETQLL